MTQGTGTRRFQANDAVDLPWPGSLPSACSAPESGENLGNRGCGVAPRASRVPGKVEGSAGLRQSSKWLTSTPSPLTNFPPGRAPGGPLAPSAPSRQEPLALSTRLCPLCYHETLESFF